MDNSLENLTKYIINEAAEQARNLLHQTRENVAAELKEAQDKFDAMLASQREQLLLQSQKRIRDASRQKSDKLNVRMTQFAAELIDSLFAEAEKQLFEMPADEFLTFYNHSLKNLNLKGAFYVTLGQFTDRSLSDEQRKRLQVETNRYNITVDKRTIPNQGGFVIEQPPIEYSFLFSDLLGELKRQDTPALLRRLIH